MTQHLNSVLKVLPAIQAKQLTAFMNHLQVEGQIKNTEEYETKLKGLASLIKDKSPKASFQKISSIVWHLITSEAHNLTMGSASDDIEALFLQIDEVGKTTDEHHDLMMKNLFADMRRGLDDQENKIKQLEWLAGQNNEFSLVLVNSFQSVSLNRTARSALGSDTLYFDNRTYENKTAAELPNAVVSEKGKKLILDVENEPRVLPLSVTLLSDVASFGTEISTNLDSPIGNIIDGTKGTFWTRNIYLSEEVEEVTTVLQFDFGLSKDVDYVIVERASEIPFFITKIEGVTSDGSYISLMTGEKEIVSDTRIDFPKVFVRGVVITFSTKSYIRAEYFLDKKSSLHNVIKPVDPFDSLAMKDQLSPLSSEVLASEDLNEMLNIPSSNTKQINAFLYPFALDNVWFGNSLYKDSGIFVSKPLKNSNFGLIALKTVEELSDNSLNSIEYEIIKRDISPKFAETKFPVLPLRQREISNERLVLTKKEDNTTISDTGMLRFCPLVNDNNTVAIYENNELLQVGEDYHYSISIESNGLGFLWNSNYSYASIVDNYTLEIPKMWIKIHRPKSNAVYTASYKIRVSNSTQEDNTVWMDKDKTIYISDDNHFIFKKDNKEVTVESEIYLQVTLRRNNAVESISPVLQEYAVLGATYNDQ